MMRALREVRSHYNFVRFTKASFLTRSIAHPYHSIPADEYPSVNYYPDGIGDAYCPTYDSRNGSYFDWTSRSYGDEFGGFRPVQSILHSRYDPPYWRSYRVDCPHDGGGWWVEGYPNWGYELCPSCRAACCWGKDGYAPHWVNGDARWNQRTLDAYGLYGREWNVNPPMAVDCCNNMVCGRPYYYGESFNPDLHPYRPNTGYFYDDGGREPLGGAHPMNSNWRSGQYPQTYYRKLDGVPMPCPREHASNFGMHWNDTAGQNQKSQNVYGLHGYDQNSKPHGTVDYIRNKVAESGKFGRTDVSFRGQTYPTRLYRKNPSATHMKPNMSYGVPYGNGGIFQGNGPRHLNVIREGDQQSLDRYEWRNESNQPRSHMSEHPNNSYSDNKHGFQNISAEHRSNFSYSPEPGRQHYSHSNEFRDGKVLDRPDSKNSASVHSNYQESRDGDIEAVQSPTLNAAHLDGGLEVPNSGSRRTENLEAEQVRGSVEELETFTKEGKLMLAVKVLDVMEKKKYRLDPEHDLSKIKMLIQACGDSKAITEAKAVHKHIVNLTSPLKFSLYNKILGMYLKCGDVSDACSMFYSMAAHNLTSWDTMIKGLVKNNLGEEALDLFAEFKNTDSEPDGPMFLGVFSACRLVGDVIEGMLHFESMTKQYGIVPSMKHYVSIVDMMGQIGHLDEAVEFIEKMPANPSVDVWETMMNVCRIQGNTELGDRCAEMVHNLDPSRLSDESRAGLLYFS